MGEAPILRIRLFGGVDLRLGEAALPPLESARAESLLAYLLLHPEAAQPRQRLAFLLWPDSAEPQARTNLRHVLHTLRRALPDPDRFIEVSPRTLRWRPDAPYWLDAAAFKEAVNRSERDAGTGQLAALREAVELYAGDLLEGCYDEWVLGERERFRERYLAALDRLTAVLEARGDLAGAIQQAERLLRHDPLREETYRLLMRLHDGRGDRARALRVYHACVATLERELGVEPASATRETYEALLAPAGRPVVLSSQTERIGGPPLVGRQAERARLTAIWRGTEGGRAHFVLVTGEPGVGKSRLVEEFRSWCEHRGAVTAEARSYPAEGALAYGPVVAWLRSEPLRTRRERLDRGYLSELARLLPELLAEVPRLARPEPLPEGDQRQRLFDAVARAILAPGGPLLLVADDLQWCDRETLQFLHYLLRVEPNAPLLVVATARPEEIDPHHPVKDLLAGLQALDRLTEISLERLSRAETTALAERLGGRPLAEPDADRLYRETEGNALFVVEALRAGWTSGHDERGWMTPKVQSAIESRLARLSDPAREVVGVAATIGRAFTTDVLAEAVEADAGTLVRGLDELWRRRIVREQGADAYDFSHDKIRDVAYETLSPVRRRRVHLRVALALERLHGRDPDPVSGQIAAHFEQAGAVDQAIGWYERAAEAALRLYANGEAIRLLDRALDLLQARPETPERRASELAVLAALPAPLGSVEGWGSERLAEVQRRALDLASALGVEPAPPILRSMAIAGLSRGDFAAARRFGDQLHRLGERDGDDMLLVEGEYMLGIAAFWQGEFRAARAHFEAAVARYHPEHGGSHLLRYGVDPGVVCLSRLGNTLWFLGDLAAAVRARDDALALADQIGHPQSWQTALTFAALLSLEMGDLDRVREAATALAAGNREHPFRPTPVAVEAIAGYLDVVDGRTEAGLARIQGTLEGSRGIDHAPGMRATIERWLLAACATAGEIRTGLAAVDRSLARGGARVWEAETRRLRADFLAALGGPASEVEAELECALDLARRQGASSLELRAALSLFRRRREHGDDLGVRRAREVLRAIVQRLPDSQASQDLREAAALLGRC